MAQARGRKAQFLLDYETIFGADPVAPAAIAMPFNSIGIKANQNLTEDNTIRNRRDPAMPTRGNIDVAGDIVVPVDLRAIGHWFKAAFGAPVTTGASAPYTHTWKPGDAQPSLVLERGFTDIGVYEKFNGCKVGKLAFSVGGDSELTSTVTIMGATQTVGATAYDETPTPITLTKFAQFQASIKEGGTAIAVVTQASLDIELNLDGDQYAIGGAGARSDIPEGIMQVSGTLTAMFKDSALLAKAVAGTESSLEITLTSGASSLKFELPEIMYGRTSPTVEGPQGVRIELPYRAYYEDAAAAAAIVVTLVNNQATY